jgi:hypothetical protein
VRGADHGEARHPLDVRSMRLGDERLILDDQHSDHDSLRVVGIVAVSTEP